MRKTSTILMCALAASACDDVGVATASSPLSTHVETERAIAVAIAVPGGAPVEAIAVAPGGWALDREATLWRIAEDTRTRVMDGVLGLPAVLPDGRFVVARLGDVPGESDLWVGRSATEGRWLAPAPGPDERPTVLPDGRVLFVSGRTGVMSVWIAALDGDGVVQRTNVGLEPGGSREGFVPSPAGPVEVADGRARWDDGYGERWSIAIEGDAP